MNDKAQVSLPSDTEVRVTRDFRAPRTLVWRAHTEAELFQRWIGGYPGWSMPVCEMDVRPGGKYRWRWRSDEDGKEFGFYGDYREVDAPREMVQAEYYDPGSTLTTTVTDPRSLGFVSVQNAVGWLTATTDPQSNTSTAGYDRNGFLRRAVNRAGGVVTFDYDSLGRVVSRSANGSTTSFSYDASTSMADPHWAVASNAESRDSISTDAQGRVTSVRSTRGSGTFTQSTTYDAAGDRRMVSITNGSWTDSLVFVNDTIQFPLQLPDFGGNWTSVRYNSDQLLDSLRYPTGGSSTRLIIHPTNYSAFHRPAEVDLLIGSALTEKRTYTYDELGRISKSDLGSDKDYTERQFTYDARGRLASYADHHIYADSVQESCPDNQITCDPPPPWDYTWHDDLIRSTTYNPDNSGNRTDGSASLSNDRLSTMTGADGRAYTFSYDAEGRLQSKTASGYSQTFGWNDLGQLIWVKTNGDSVAFGYDASGHRVRKYHGGTTTAYLWDGDNLLMQLDGSGNRTFEYSYQAGIDQPVAVKTGGAMYYYQLDEAGNVVALWNASNTQVASYTYDPFGYAIATSGTLTQPLQWKGREYDAETGLYYVRARYYDPTVGRFLSEDPAGVAAGINPYTFADGEPVNRVDPSGKDPCTPALLQLGFTTTEDSLAKGGAWCVAPVVLPPVVSSPSDDDPDGLWAAVVNGIAGFGDFASLGLSYDAREVLGGNENIDFTAKSYNTGGAVSLATLRMIQSLALSEALFARGSGLLNSNRYLRLGVGRYRGYEVFRISGQWVNDLPGWAKAAMGENNGHLLNVPLRRLP